MQGESRTTKTVNLKIKTAQYASKHNISEQKILATQWNTRSDVDLELYVRSVQ